MRILYLNAKIEPCVNVNEHNKVFHRRGMLYSSSQVQKHNLSSLIQQPLLLI